MALQGRGRPRDYFKETEFKNTSELIHNLLEKELGAELIQEDDQTKPAQWAPTLEDIRKRQEEMGLFKHLQDKGIDTKSIPLDPFAVDSGIYTVIFVGAELRPIEGNADYEMSINLQFQIQDDNTPQGEKFAGKQIFDSKWIPSEFMAESNTEEAEKAVGFVIQRLGQLGVGEPDEVDVSDINAQCVGNKYKLKWDRKKGADEESRQFVHWVRPVKESNVSDLL